MRVPREHLPPDKCELRLILEGQGVQNCMMILEAEVNGARFRKHVEECAECGEIKRELYGDKPIPVRPDSFVH